MRFCGNCGTALAPAAAPEAGEERRLVTVLFADLAGFTALAESLDPEDLRNIVSRFYAAITAEIKRYGGTVEKYVGDAALAIFGLPEVHEDDAERAVRAALSMRVALARLNEQLAAEGGPALAMRIGINTGEVVADPKGGGLGEFHLAADALNVAARLQQGGRAGSILIGPRTQALIRGVVETRSLGGLTLKGKAEPVPAWEVVGLRAERAQRGIAGRQAPLIGRSTEMDLLLRLYDRIVSERRSHLVTVFGLPGVGKSRLQAELTGLLRALPGPPAIRKGRCLPYGDGLAFWPVAEILKQESQILDGDPPEVAREKLTRAVAQLLPEDGQQVAAALGFLIGIVFPEAAIGGYDPKSAREEAFVSWRRYLQARAAAHPLVLVIEDLHWGDDGLLDLFDYAVARLAETPVLFLCLARPDLLERRPQWGGAARNATRINLDPLTQGDARRLITALLPAETLPGPVIERILSAAEGNPFFVEEIVRLLIERGALAEGPGGWTVVGDVHDLPIPDTIQGVLAARLDRLPAEEKRVLQSAAVVGRIFWRGTLRSLLGSETDLGAMLDALETRDLIREHAASTLAGDREFIFKHILTREVAYASLPRAVRARLHAQVAQWIEQTAAGRLGELVDLLAYHWSSAGNLERAVDYLIKGGDRARQLFANRRAAEVYTRALELGGARLSGAERRHLYHKRGEVRQLLGEYDAAEADFRAALEEARREREAAAEAQLLFELTRIRYRRRRGSIPEIIAGYEEAHQKAIAAGDRRTEGLCLLETANAHWDEGRGEEASRLGEEAAGILEREGDHGAVAAAMNFLSTVRWLTVDLVEALAWADRGVAEARAAGDRSREATGLSYVGLYTGYAGRMTEALDHLDRAERVAGEIEDRRRLMWVHFFRGDVLQRIGRYDRALGELERSRAIADELRYLNPLMVAVLAETYRTLGEFGRAHTVIDGVAAAMPPADVHRVFVLAAHAALVITEGVGGGSLSIISEAEASLRRRHVQPNGLRSGGWMAHALALAGETARAADLARHLLSLIPAGWLPDLAARLSLTLALEAIAGGRLDEAETHLERAETRIQDMGFLALLAEIALTRSRLAALRGQEAARQASAETAGAILAEISGRIDDVEVHALFEGSPLARRAQATDGAGPRT